MTPEAWTSPTRSPRAWAGCARPETWSRACRWPAGCASAEAKSYVADRLGCTVRDLSDSYAMEQIRGEKGLGRILDHSNLHPGEPNAMTAKFRIAEVLGVPINSVDRFRQLAGL